MNEPQMGNVVSAEELSRPNVETPAVSEEKICCTRCAAEIPDVDSFCPVCGFDWHDSRKQKITRYFYYFCIGFIFSLLTPLLPQPVPGNLLAPMLLRILVSVLSVIGTVFGMMFLYQCWSLIPKKNRSAWPGQYVGFLFVPFYNLYWMFPSYYGLVRRQEALLPEEKKGNRGIMVLLFLILPYVFLLFMLIAVFVLILSGVMHRDMFLCTVQSPLYKLGLLVIYVIPMSIIGVLAFLQIKKGACSLMELSAEEKKKLMMSVPGAPGSKKTALWPVWTSGGCGCLLFLLCFILLVVAVVGGSALMRNMQFKQHTDCMGNLMGIGLCLKSYADNNGGQFPVHSGKVGLEAAFGYKPSAPYPNALICPIDKESSSANFSYIYLGGLNNRMPPDTIVAFCVHPWNNSRKKLYNVLYVNGTATIVDVSGRDGYIELFRKSGILDNRNAFTAKGKQLPQETRDYILRLMEKEF